MKKSYKSKFSLPKDIEIEVIWEDDKDVDIEAVKKFVGKLKRPGWYKSDSQNKDTKEYMLNNSEYFDSKRTTSVDPFTEKKRFEWLCSQCKCGTTYGGIDIGHRTNWKEELISAGVLNKTEAKAAYNNLVNLRLECATCNRSHDWEESDEGGMDIDV
ncbi:MAG: GH-E family nuclease [Blastocatellia bacterium]